MTEPVLMRLRPSWDDVWMRVADDVSTRSLCVRAQIGAVIVDTCNRVIATGYNGPPAGFPHGDSPCTRWCDRGKLPENIEVRKLERDYSDCPALHAEANALLAADRSTWQGGTIYVLGDICFACAKLIANSGLAEVVVSRPRVARWRDPERSYRFLESCGLNVILYDARNEKSEKTREDER